MAAEAEFSQCYFRHSVLLFLYVTSLSDGARVPATARSKQTPSTPGPGCTNHGGGTYYIHEYHVHGEQNGTFNGAVRPIFPSCNASQHLEDKSQLLRRLQDSEAQLAEERTRRLGIMTNVLSWLNTAQSTSSAQQHLGVLQDMLSTWSDVEDWNYTAIAANMTKQPVPCSTPCSSANVSTAVKDSKRDLRRLQKRYLSVHDGFKRVLATTRELRRDLRSWEHRAGRLLQFYEQLLGRGGDIGSESLFDVVQSLKERVTCLEKIDPDPVQCPNVKLRPRTTTTTQGTTTTTTTAAATTTATTTTVRPSEMRSTEEATVGRTLPSEGDSEHPVIGSEFLADGLVQAGIEVTSWYLKELQSQRPRDCSDIDYWIQRRDPVQVIYLSGRTRPIKALCDGDGWTVVMRNNPYGMDRLTDVTSWQAYKYGFGTFESDLFWFGNQYLHELTHQEDYQMRLDMVHAFDDQAVFTEYAFFKVTAEQDGYRLNVGDSQGSAGDVLGVHSETPVDRMPFATVDRHSPHLDNLFGMFHVGWWYPSGDVEYEFGGKPEPCFTHLMHDYPWTCGSQLGYQALNSVTMKIRPLNDGI